MTRDGAEWEISVATGTHAEREAVYDVIEQAEARLTPSAAALLEPRLRAPAASPSAPE